MTKVRSWEEMYAKAICTTAAGNIAVQVSSWRAETQQHTVKEIQVWGDRMGTTLTIYDKLCNKHGSRRRWISEMSAGKYLADLCVACGEIWVIDMATCQVYQTYSHSPSSLFAMCSGPGEGSLLVWDNESEAVIQLQWNEATKKLDEVRQVVVRQVVPGGIVSYMCYISHTDLVILSHCRGNKVQAVKLQGGAVQRPVWQLQGEVLGKKIYPGSVSSDSEGRVYVGDVHNSRVLSVNGSTGKVIKELLQDAELGVVYDVCCLSNPHQLLVLHCPPPYYYKPTLSLYNMSSL